MNHLRIVLCALCLSTLAARPVSAGRWLTYTGMLVEGRYFDGDNFNIRAQTRHTYIFRLYGVDCPETEARYPDRIREQAAYFGIPEQDVIAWGEVAAAFVRDFLKDGATVHTRKEKAGGTSRRPRYFAIVKANGKRLDEALLENGLARAIGMPVAWPTDENMDEAQFMRRLRRIESKARHEKKGIWAGGTPRKAPRP